MLREEDSWFGFDVQVGSSMGSSSIHLTVWLHEKPVGYRHLFVNDVLIYFVL